MDLNHLLHQHQVSLMRSAGAACAEAQRAHDELAAGFAARIAELRHASGASGVMVTPA